MAQQVTWARQFGVQGNAYAQHVSAGEGVYVTGGIRLGEALPGQVAAGGQDAFIRRYDNDGSIRWTRQFGTAGNDEARGVVYSNGYIYMAGFVEGALPGQIHSGDADAYLRKYDGYGNVLWTRQFGTAQRDEAFSVAVSGNRVYVNGGTRGAFPGFTNPGGTIDTFVRGYDTNGNLLWTQEFSRGGTSDDQPAGLAADNTGVYLGSRELGRVNSDVLRFDLWGALRFRLPLAMEVTALTQDSNSYYILGKIPSAGVLSRLLKSTNLTQWSAQFGSGSYEPRAATVDNGGIVVVSNTDLYPQNQTGLGPAQVNVRRYLPSSQELWSYEFGGGGWEVPTGVSYAYGYLYVSGLTTGWMAGTYQRDALVVKLHPATEFTQQIGTAIDDKVVDVTAAGVYSYAIGVKLFEPYVRQYNADGGLIWERSFPTSETLGHIAATANTVFVSGERQTAQGQTVAWVRRYELNGNLTWETLLQPLPASGVTNAPYLAASPDFLWVAGATTGVFTQFGQTGGIVPRDIYVGGLLPASGSLQWVRQIGSSRDDYPKGITTAGSGAAVVGSYFYSAWLRMIDAYGNLGPSHAANPPLTFPGETLGVVTTPYGLYTVAADLWGANPVLRRYTTDGTFQWEQPLNIQSATANFLATDGSSLYLGGQAGSTVFVHSYTLNGVEQWRRGIHGIRMETGGHAPTTINALAAQGAGNVFLGGTTTGLMPGATVYHGRTDGYFMKIVGPAGAVPRL